MNTNKYSIDETLFVLPEDRESDHVIIRTNYDPAKHLTSKDL